MSSPSREQNDAWARVNALLDEGKGDTEDYRDAWAEWERIVTEQS